MKKFYIGDIIMTIKGNRVTLKPITESDLSFICKIESDKKLWLFEEDILTDHEQIKQKFIKRMNSATAYDFILQLNNEKKTPIGDVNIWSYIESRKSWEIGYTVLPTYQNQGFCAEALKLLLDYAFNELEAHKVVAMCNENNISSYKVMEKIGMTREGVFREEYLWNGKWVNQLFYNILESEYTKYK